MNFETINTPADLEAANSVAAQTALEAASEALKELDMEETLSVAKTLVENLAGFHHTIAQKLIDEGRGDDAVAWVYDEGLLKSALVTLSCVS